MIELGVLRDGFGPRETHLTQVGTTAGLVFTLLCAAVFIRSRGDLGSGN